jgi:predicted ATPase/class 3 adenylate cyclase
MATFAGGPVTFLFTDIEGSTRLWDEHPDAMREALRHHDDLLRDCIESDGGRVFKTMGDAFCAVFANPRGAVQAVLAAHQWLPALTLETPDGPLPLKVRMALHTGVMEERDGDYFGQPLNRVARLLAIGHGGQVLLSLAAAELVRDHLPAGVSLSDLGEHQLKDLGRPETVFQLGHPDLVAAFPPLRSLDNPELKHNLPRQPTRFIGRDKELDEVKALLGRSALVTLTGSGGCGKTRLALQVGAEALEQFPDGVWLVALGAISDPFLVPQTVASALGLKELPGKSLTQAIADYLKSRELLLLLDTCEHLLDACASLADMLLHSCPGARVLATSREGLGIAGELAYRVPSLPAPDPQHDTTLFAVERYEAVQLFVERAQFHQPQFAVTNRNAPAVASVCHRLDGIPLAIELAAARVRAMPVEQIEQRLDQRFRLLTGGSRTALPRQQTLRALIDWSYNLLNDREKGLMCRLSAFAGGWTLEAAEQVCEGDAVEEWEILDLLTSLVDKSLVIYLEEHGSARYRLLDTVRQYARDRLLECAAGEIWRDRHLEFFLALGEEAEPHLQEAEQAEWLTRLEAEHANLRAALEWSEAAPGRAEQGVRLGASIWRFWQVHGHLSEGRERLARALASEEACDASRRARALDGAGVLAYYQCDYPAAQTAHEEGLAIRRQLGDQRGIAACLNDLGNTAHAQGDYAAAQARYEESLAIRREMDDRRGIAASLNNLGSLAFQQGDDPAARELITESLSILGELGDQRSIALSMNNLGEVVYRQGDYLEARALFRQSLAIRKDLGARVGIAYSMEGLAATEFMAGVPLKAGCLWGAAERLREEVGAPLPPKQHPEHEQQVELARVAVGDEAAFDAAWQEGRVMTLEQAIAYALAECGP